MTFLLALMLTQLVPQSNPVEVGQVAWGRDFDRALAESKRTGAPVFAFFQEVPGCAGCQKFGAEVMSDRLLVQAIEHEFVPVLIYNNRAGRDAELLKRFGEPAWNYQVVRFLDEKGTDLIPRRDRVWSRTGIARRMIKALKVAGRRVPGYLEVSAYESDVDALETAVFAQSCFWTGEFQLGQIAGVISTEAGWLKNEEVTRVRFHPDLLSLDVLVEAARADGNVYRKKAAGYRPADASHQKKQIQRSGFAKLDLTPMQRTKVNAFGPVDMQLALEWLSPDQRAELSRLE